MLYLWRQRRKNLMILRAAWSCFLVSRLLLNTHTKKQLWSTGKTVEDSSKCENNHPTNHCSYPIGLFKLQHNPDQCKQCHIKILVALNNPSNSPEFLLYNGGCPTVLLPLPTFFVAAVVLLDQHCGSSALLEFFLLIIASEFALDKNGSLCHLFIKCILQEKQRKAEAFQNQNKTVTARSRFLQWKAACTAKTWCKANEDLLTDWELLEKRATAN